MSLIAELTLHGDVLLFDETFEGVPNAECAFEDVHYVTDDEGNARYVFFWWVTDCEFDEFDRALEADATVSAFRTVAKARDRRLYRVATKWVPPEQPLVFPLFREYDVTAIESRRNADGLHLQARFPTRRSLQNFLDDATEIARHTDVNRLYTEDPMAPDEYVLSEKQREVLSLAAERGYFATPSGVTLAELAESLDISPQAMSKHIRAAVEKLVERELARLPTSDSTETG